MRKDSSDIGYKIELRKKLLSFENKKNIKILDLFCGNGAIYNKNYKEHEYKGIDKYVIFDKKLCVLEDNVQFLSKHKTLDYNFYDLDSYGCPLALLFKICQKIDYKSEFYYFAITDGGIKAIRKQKFPLIFNATCNIPRKMKIPSFEHFYEDNLFTIIKKISRMYKLRPINIYIKKNKINLTYYIGMVFKNGKKNVIV